MGKGSELIKEVVGKLDKLGHLPDLLLKAGLAYAGFRATEHWTGAVTALVGFKLAEGHNLAGGAAGVTALTLIGLGNAFKDIRHEDIKHIPGTGIGKILALTSP